jgi:hypothetical protein
MSTNNIALAKVQRVFAAKEHTKGSLTFPSGTDFVKPAGNAVLNQSPSFSDSEELSNTLDVLDQFQDATPPGDWSLTMYARPGGLGSDPQGAVLFESLLGTRVTGSTASLHFGIAADSTQASYRNLSGSLPEKGVIQIGTEYIYYGGITETNATQGVFTSLSRAYSGSAAVHAVGANITLKSIFFKEATKSSSFSLWIETDHFIQGLSGCTASRAVIGVDNQGAVGIDFSGQGMEMVWAGTCSLASDFSAGATTIKVEDAKLYSAGSYIQNYTQSINNSNKGFEVLSSNATNDTLLLGTAITGTWASGDVIKGYLPTETQIGTAIEGKDTAVEFNNVSTSFRNCDLTVSCPKQYITDEVGTIFPQDYMEDVREITSTLGLYFRESDAKFFRDGYDGNEIPIKLTFGNTAGYKMELFMKKCRLQVPTINPAAPAMELQIPMKALGTTGEDSLEVCFN